MPDIDTRPPATYGWLINSATEDVDDQDAVGTLGPGNIGGPMIDKLRAGEGSRFRIFDDDGILYYEGRGLACRGLEPLEDFGTPNAGATRIDWQEGPTWRTA